MVNIAVIGAGGWGKNLVRNFGEMETARLHTVCDLDKARLEEVRAKYPATQVSHDYDAVLHNPNIEAVVIATNAPTHYSLAKKALLAGKHTYVEKPLTLDPAQAEELIEIADKAHKKLMVGHLMIYHPAIVRLKELIDEGALGEVYYIYCQRLNLGIVRKDENSWWSLAPHDISIALFLLGEAPVDISARGQCYLQQKVEDTVFANLFFLKKKMVQIHVSWLDPNKMRRVTVVGSKGMVVFDDVEPTEKLRIYDKTAEVSFDYASYGDSITLRSGDISIPVIRMAEPLKLECGHFVECIASDTAPRTGGKDGLDVVRVLTAGQRSIEKRGAPVPIH